MGISLPYVNSSAVSVILIMGCVDIAWHMEAGLLMQINSLPSVAAKLDFPSDVLRQCNA